jgi:RimJ/RimL family protein N-acetyltransferase
LIEGYYIDNLKVSDRDGLLDIIESGTDYPFWYRNGQSHEAAANEHISFFKTAQAKQPKDQFKAIRTKEGRLIGCVQLLNFDKETCAADLSYFLHEDYQGKRIGTEAVFDVVQSAVANDGLKTLRSTVHPRKVASQIILLNLGFTVDGYQPVSSRPERDGSPAPRVIMQDTEQNLAAALERHFSSKHPVRDIPLTEGFYIDNLKTTDGGGLLDIMRSGTDYPYWYNNGQSDKDAADEYVSRVKEVESKQSDDLYKAIRTKKGRLIGCVYLDNFDKKTGEAELNYFLHSDYQGKKIGREAVFDVVQDAITNDGLKSLHITVRPDKIASIKILLNLGFFVTDYVKIGPYPERDGSPAPRIFMNASEEGLAAALEKHFSPNHPVKDFGVPNIDTKP